MIQSPNLDLLWSEIRKEIRHNKSCETVPVKSPNLPSCRNGVLLCRSVSSPSLGAKKSAPKEHLVAVPAAAAGPTNEPAAAPAMNAPMAASSVAKNPRPLPSS